MIADSIILNDTFRFEAGGALEGMKVVFHKSMDEYDGKTRVLWICHALTANSDAEEWWPQLVGPGKLFDTRKYFVVCVNVPGSPYGTTGPSSIDPSTGKPYFLAFPKITVRDMVRAMIEVRKHLGIRQIDLLIGSSIGGFQAVEWAVMEPGAVRNLVLMATDVRVSPWMTAWCESQRMALEADQTFREAASLEGGDAGMRCARAQALISYRSYEGYCRTQSEPDPDTLFAERAASYQRYQGEKLSRRFDAYSYYYLCNALDSHNVGRGRGGVQAALKGKGRRRKGAFGDNRADNGRNDRFGLPFPGRGDAALGSSHSGGSMHRHILCFRARRFPAREGAGRGYHRAGYCRTVPLRNSL